MTSLNRKTPPRLAAEDELRLWAHRLECAADDHRRLSCDRTDNSRAAACDRLAAEARRMARK